MPPLRLAPSSAATAFAAAGLLSRAARPPGCVRATGEAAPGRPTVPCGGLAAHPPAFRCAFAAPCQRFSAASAPPRHAQPSRPNGRPGFSFAAAARRRLAFAAAGAAAGATVLVLAPRYSFAGRVLSSAEAILPPTSGPELDLMDGDPSIAIKDKPTKDLLRSWMVYKLCSFTWLVEITPRLIAFAEKVHCTGLIHWITRYTFFKHFCGGETVDEVNDLMKKLGAANIGVILDLSVEADVNPLAGRDDPSARKMYNDRADQLRDAFKEAIVAATANEKTFVAVKVTALASPDLLLNISNLLDDVRRLFVEADGDRDGKISRAEFRKLAAALGQRREVTSARAAAIDRFFAEADRDGDGAIDYIDLTDALSFESADFAAMLFAAGEPVTPLTREAIEDARVAMGRLDSLCALAADKRVYLMVDAEQTYIQPAVDHAALKMQRKYNSCGHHTDPVVYNTYQLYLKDGLARLKQDYERARRDGYTFAAKLVRGAYMVGEARYAQERHLPDPVLPSIDATHASYHAGVDFLLDKIAAAAKSGERTPVLFMVASHNHQTILRTCSEMDRLGIPRREASVTFGQLLGMQDHVTYTLAANGFASYKYVPFGPLKDVIPYLLRRATENSSMLSGTSVELNILSSEIKRRVRRAVGLPPPPPPQRSGGKATGV